MPRRARHGWTRGRRGAGRNHAAKGGAAAVAVNPITDAHIWYDFTDISTLWQDTGGTSAVAADGDPIARVDDKGSLGVNITQATGSKQPAYDTDFVSHGGGLFDGTDVLFAAAVAQTAVQSGDFSALLIGSFDDTLTTDYWIGWDIHELSFRKDGSESCFPGCAGVAFDTSPTVPTATLVGVMIHEETGNVQASDYSWGAADGAGSSASGGPDDASDLVVGAIVSAPSAPLFGTLHEILIRSPKFTAGERTSIQEYVVSKYGITWA